MEQFTSKFLLTPGNLSALLVPVFGDENHRFLKIFSKGCVFAIYTMWLVGILGLRFLHMLPTYINAKNVLKFA